MIVIASSGSFRVMNALGLTEFVILFFRYALKSACGDQGFGIVYDCFFGFQCQKTFDHYDSATDDESEQNETLLDGRLDLQCRLR